MKARELRKIRHEELKAKMAELRKELMKLRTQAAMTPPKNTSQIKNIKKNIARILTVISEKKKHG